MRRFVCSLTILVAALALSTAPAQAQFFVGAGLTAPSGDFGDGFKAGFGVTAGVALLKSRNERAKLWVEGFFGQNNLDSDLVDGKSTIIGGFVSGTYDLTAQSTAVPYLVAGGGYLSQKIDIGGIDATEGGAAFFGGTGVSLGKIWFEGRYTTASIADGTTAFISGMIGYSF